MSETTYTVEPDPNGVTTLWRHDGPDDEHPTPLADTDEDWHDVFHAAAAVLAPDDEVRQLVEKAVKDAYYNARDNGGTMHTAAEDARDAVLAALKSHATGGDDDE
jgi:hypothetical protein